MEAIVIPTFNERKNIGLLIDEVFKNLPKSYVFVVDDKSPDKTAEVVREYQKKYKNLNLILRMKDKGRGASVLAGFQNALKKYPEVSYFIEMDSDFSHNPADIPKLLKAANKNIISIGSRYIRGSVIEEWPFKRIILSRMANTYIRFFLGIPIADYTMGFRCYSREALESLNLSKIKHKGFITLSEIAYKLYKNGFSFIEVPVILKDRTRGQSNANFKEVLKSFFAVFAIRFNL